MKKFIFILTCLSLSCESFERPLALEDCENIRFYRCISMDACCHKLEHLKEYCDDHGWDEHSSLEMEEIIESMKHNLGFPKE